MLLRMSSFILFRKNIDIQYREKEGVVREKGKLKRRKRNILKHLRILRKN